MDVYRSAQFKNWIAGSARKHDQDKARKFYNELLDSPWNRGRFFAKQNLADMDRDGAQLVELCEEIEDEQRKNGGIDASDIERFNWTLQLAEQVLSGNLAHQDRLTRLQSSIIETISQVVSVATYMPVFEKRLRPRIRNLARQRLVKWREKMTSSTKLSSEAFDNLVDELERFAAREVSEVLRRNKSRRDQASADIRAFLLESEDVPQHADPKGRTATRPPFLFAADEMSPEVKSVMVERVAQARAVEEQYWLDNPLQVQTPVASASQIARSISVRDQQHLLLRYALVGNEGDAEIVAFWWYRGKAGATPLGPDAVQLSKEFASETLLKQTRLVIRGEHNSMAPSLEYAKRLWDMFLLPAMKEISALDEAKPQAAKRRVTRVTICLDSGLYHLPLQMAWVPTDHSNAHSIDLGVESKSKVGEPESDGTPLGLLCYVAFTLNLSSHLLDNRRSFGTCLANEDDDLVVLEHDAEGYFPACSPPLKEEVQHWHAINSRSRYYESAGEPDIASALNNRAEFLMFACHGHSDPELGPYLTLKERHLISHNLSYGAPLKGNKVLFLGACESSSASRESYGKLIGSFIAAGAGAVVGNPCSPLVPTVCHVAAGMFSQIRRAPNGCDLAAALLHAAREAYQQPNIHLDEDHELLLMATTHQLWL
ncbi:CHAT domain-containing protein [Lacipirellula parvula]|uniref:CHAT domain-containing protein n=1 Tax=Lacipirellula parvula TaxID=2650471 RepID=A0A5K7XE51_9BACT|nr:CHAT domain-containing protein [Lacipirellula parvula]BBO34337.1 hypothetical protein PLANPX_3949 [Lacipirellula parvula]